MRISLPIRLASGVVVLALAAAACSSDDSSDSATTPEETTTTEAPTTSNTAPAEQTIVEIASSEADFSTLVTAVTAAGLVETLSGPGPFTVFAPTNAAFAKIPEDQLTAILADTAQLTAILTYHVLPAAVASADLQPSQQVETVQGDTVDIQVADGKATINGCNIVQTDIVASNGVIHVIDCVLTP